MADPCAQEGRLATLEHQDKVQSDTLARIEAKMDLMIIQIGKVPVLELNHEHQAEAVGRAFGELNAMRTAVSNHDRYVYITTGVILAVSVFWTIAGYRVNAQIDDVVKAVAEMRAHIDSDKIKNADDVNKAAK